MKKLLELVANHNNCAMTAEQQDMAVDIMYPMYQVDDTMIENTVTSSNKLDKNSPSSKSPVDRSKNSAKLKAKNESDRNKAKLDLQSNSSGLHMFGTIHFNLPSANQE
eukprot:scaffold1077_cov178-Ochromonas_danica.AAC.8